jgi:hypothetical protein
MSSISNYGGKYVEVTPEVCEMVSGTSRSASWVAEIASTFSSGTIESSHLICNSKEWYRTHLELVRGHIELLCRYHPDEP